MIIFRILTVRLWLCTWVMLVLGCSAETDEPQTLKPAAATADVATDRDNSTSQAIASNPLKNAYFGDTHVHTELSLDAFLWGTRSTPHDAYVFAKGGAIEHASGLQMQLKEPLDFLAVTDHANYLGTISAIADPEGAFEDHVLSAPFRASTDAQGSHDAFAALFEYFRVHGVDARNEMDNAQIESSAWQQIIDAADRHNQPGRFTSFVGYEYTSAGPESQNLHRNVIFRGASVPPAPFNILDSPNPEDLWTWMDKQRAHGMDALAIPHNPNGSDGWMFAKHKWAGEELDRAWAEQRMRNEPIVENTQVKGTSDTHPLLSPNDEWADFEIMPLRVAITNQQPSRPQGSYVREALGNGLLLEESLGFNPFQFGVIGSSDTHNAAGSFDEANYWSKTGVTDIEPYQRGSVPIPASARKNDAQTPQYANEWSKYWGASGLAGVWAESNTREAIFDAMRRKETFSTSGPRIRVRFFAGTGFDASQLHADDGISHAYLQGVPMGSELLLDATQEPKFFVWAAQDPYTYPLQRLQVIKGWVQDGELQEQVFDVACSDGLNVDPAIHRCPDNGARVNLSDCSVTASKGDPELSVLWRDPLFDPAQRAFYYVRVLQNPSCRWSTYDAIRAGVPPRPDMHATIQDRAWSSPIWVAPAEDSGN